MIEHIRPEFTPDILPTFNGYHLQIFAAGRAKISLQTGTMKKKHEFFASRPKKDRAAFKRQKVRSLAVLPDHFAAVDQILSDHPDAKVFRLHEKGNNNATADNAHLLASLEEASLWLVMSGVVHKWVLSTLLVHVLLEGKGKRVGEASIFNEYVARLSPNIRKYSQAQGATLAELATLSEEYEHQSLTAQTQRRIWRQMQQFLDWCVHSGSLEANPWDGLLVRDKPEVRSHRVLSDEQVSLLLNTKDRVLHSALLFCLLTGMRSGEACGLLAEDVSTKGNLGRFVQIRPNAVRLLKSKAAEREVPLHPVLEQLLDQRLPSQGRLFPSLNADRIVKRYACLRTAHRELHGTVFHSTRKWFITQCERTGVPEHFTASLVGHQSARSENKLTYGLYSAGISDTQKREIIDQVRLPQDVLL
jgi:integrase